MLCLLRSLLLTLRDCARARGVLQLELLALRHQLQVLERTRPRRVPLTRWDRLLWVWLSRRWTAWRGALVIVKPETCEKRKSVCVKMGHAIAEAVAYLHDHPAETLALLKKRFGTLDDKILAAGFEQIRKATSRPPIVVRGAFENGERYSIEAGLLKAEEKLKSYDGLFTDEYVR